MVERNPLSEAYYQYNSDRYTLEEFRRVPRSGQVFVACIDEFGVITLIAPNNSGDWDNWKSYPTGRGAPARPRDPAWEQYLRIYDEERSKLRAIARLRTGDPYRAEDAVQAAMIAAAGAQPAEEVRPGAFLVGCLINKAREARREAGRETLIDDPKGPDSRADAERRSADEALALEELKATVHAALARLSHLQQQALALKIEGLKGPEAAAKLGISATAYRSHLKRAKDVLRGPLGHLYETWFGGAASDEDDDR